MDDKVWLALQELGYGVTEDRGISGMLRPLWLPSEPFDSNWFDNGIAMESCHETEAKAKAACLDHLRANKETMMNRMVKAIGTESVFIWQHDKENWWTARVLNVNGKSADGDEPSDAVYALWCKVKGAPDA